MSAEPLLSVAGLSAGYGEAQALWDVSLVVQSGYMVVLLGSN